MGGIQVPAQGSGDDGFDEEGYDESQRAEILEATGSGPTDGAILTDLTPDLGKDSDEEDDLQMEDDELGEEDDDVGLTATSQSEDEVQADFDEDELEDDDDLDAADDESLKP